MISGHVRFAGFVTLNATIAGLPACAAKVFSQMVCGLSSSTFSPVAGSKHSATWLNHTLKKSVSSVIVPTVEREVLTVFVCAIAIDGRMFSIELTFGLLRSLGYCRVLAGDVS